MSKLRIAMLAVALLLAGLGGGAMGFDNASAHTSHAKTHPTTAHVVRREHHHGSGVKSHQHHARHARHARTHGHHGK